MCREGSGAWKRGIFSILMQSRTNNRQLMTTVCKHLTLPFFIEEHNNKIIKIERLIKHYIRPILFEYGNVCVYQCIYTFSSQEYNFFF